MLQLGVVLERYTDPVITAVCDPRTGIQRRSKFPPSIAEMVEALENEAVRQQRMAEYAALPKPDFTRKRLRPPPAGPGAWATILYRPDVPHYQRMVDRAMSGKEDPRKWKWDDDGKSIWVAYSWVDGPSPSKGFVQLTDEQLLAKYGPIKKPEPSPAAETEEIPF